VEASVLCVQVGASAARLQRWTEPSTNEYQCPGTWPDEITGDDPVVFLRESCWQVIGDSKGERRSDCSSNSASGRSANADGEV